MRNYVVAIDLLRSAYLQGLWARRTGTRTRVPGERLLPPRERVEKARPKGGRDRMPPRGRRGYSPDRTEQQRECSRLQRACRQ